MTEEVFQPLFKKIQEARSAARELGVKNARMMGMRTPRELHQAAIDAEAPFVQMLARLLERRLERRVPSPEEDDQPTGLLDK